eukprot:1194440-Prorocentrum_minimum.AAC.8
MLHRTAATLLVEVLHARHLAQPDDPEGLQMAGHLHFLVTLLLGFAPSGTSSNNGSGGALQNTGALFDPIPLAEAGSGSGPGDGKEEEKEEAVVQAAARALAALRGTGSTEADSLRLVGRLLPALRLVRARGQWGGAKWRRGARGLLRGVQLALAPPGDGENGNGGGWPEGAGGQSGGAAVEAESWVAELEAEVADLTVAYLQAAVINARRRSPENFAEEPSADGEVRAALQVGEALLASRPSLLPRALGTLVSLSGGDGDGDGDGERREANSRIVEAAATALLLLLRAEALSLQLLAEAAAVRTAVATIAARASGTSADNGARQAAHRLRSACDHFIGAA